MTSKSSKALSRPSIVDRRILPLFTEIIKAPTKASELELCKIPPRLAVELNALWHSRLPYAQLSPWRLTVGACYQGTCFAVALWNNPSARNLPQSWLELRRMAVAPDAPHCTASWMLGAMRKWISKNMKDVEKLISYQDKQVHTGTIYKAAGWLPAWESKARVRDRSKPRKGTRRAYRMNSNGSSPDASAKTRWEIQTRQYPAHSGQR